MIGPLILGAAKGLAKKAGSKLASKAHEAMGGSGKSQDSKSGTKDQNSKRKEAPEPYKAGMLSIPGYDKGGKVGKTGLAKLKKGEEVLTPKQAEEYRRSTGKKVKAVSSHSGRVVRKGGKGKAGARKKGTGKTSCVR